MEVIKNFFSTTNILDTCVFVLKPLLIILAASIIIKILVKITNRLLDKSALDKGIKSFVKSSLKIVLWFIAIIMAMDMVGVDTSSLVALFGVVSLALSLSFQNIMTNVFSGITILLSKPFSVGDYVEIAGVGGTVKAITLMKTKLVTADKKIELVSNSDVWASRITNYSLEPIRRVEIKVSASYDAPTEVVKNAVFEVLNKDNRIKQDENMKPKVRLNAYNPNDIEYIIRLWVDNSEYWNVYFDVLENIRESFNTHNVQFSYPHIVVHQQK